MFLFSTHPERYIHLVKSQFMKKFLLLVVVLCVCLTSQAQEWKFGVTGGMNLNSVTGEQNKIGYTVGVKTEYFFHNDKGWYMDLGLQLANKNWKSTEYYDVSSKKSSVWSANPHFLNIPIHVGYMLPVSKNFSVFLNAGPYVGVGLFGKNKVTTDGKDIIADKNIFNENLKRFDCGVGTNIGAQIGKNMQLSVGYQWGLTNLKTKNRPMDYKNRSLEVSLGVMF